MLHRDIIALPDVPLSVVVRPRPRDDGHETLVFFEDCIHTLEGDGTDASPFELGPKLQLKDGATGGLYILQRDPFLERRYPDWQLVGPAVYDAASNSVQFFDGLALMRLDANNVVTLIAGSRGERGVQSGTDSDAQFYYRFSLATDGAGSTYVSDCGAVHRVVSAGEAGSASGRSSGAIGVVSKFLESEWSYKWLACDAAEPCQLLAANDTALYRVRLVGGRPLAPVLVAGRQGEGRRCDGRGAKARFGDISRILAGGVGRSVHLTDGGWIRRVDLQTCDVTTLFELRDTDTDTGTDTAKHSHYCTCLALLPGGILAATISGSKKLYIVWDRGLDVSIDNPSSRSSSSDEAVAVASSPPPPPPPPASAARPSSALGSPSSIIGSLPSAFRRLLVKVPASSMETVAVKVGARIYRARRGVLEGHSDYFRRLLDGGSAESRAAAEGCTAFVTLPDADPAAFSALLHYMQTRVLEVPEPFLHSTIELAERLMLVNASEQLQQRLLLAFKPATAVEDLLWAKRQGLRHLAVQLKGQVMAQVKKVMKATPREVLKQAMAECPDLLADLLEAAFERPM